MFWETRFEMLLQAWWGFFDKKWVTAQEIIDFANDEVRMGVPDWEHGRSVFNRWMALRGAVNNLAATKISGCDLDSILDEVKDKVAFNFLVERDGSCVQPMKWRILWQDPGKMSLEEYKDFRAKMEEAGSRIDPATAEVYQSWGDPFDPHEVEDFPPESQTSEKLYWARSCFFF